MRAIQMELEAFGPYRKKQVIDFNQLGNEPIFLITGPTGAGKTTIFDAICYSLYGKASGTDRDQDVFRSHFASADEITTVTFIFMLHEKLYKITRSPKQWKRKARGQGYTEEPASASLYIKNSEGDWQLIQSKIKEVNENIHALIGLDYEQFRKMMMIPQGEFRKLISENSREREDVLQKIFRTYFYQDLTEKMKSDSKSLQESMEQIRWKIEQEIEKVLDGNDDDIKQQDPIDTEGIEKKVEELEREKATVDAKLIKLESQLKDIYEQYYKGKQLLDWFEEYEQRKIDNEKLLEQSKDIENKKSMIQLAYQADKIYPIEKQMLDREKEWKDQEAVALNLKSTFTQQKEKFTTIEIEYLNEKDKEQEREQLRKIVEQQRDTLQKLQEYHELKRQLDKMTEAIEKQESTITQIDNEIVSLEKKKEENFKQKELIYQKQQHLQELHYQIEKKIQDQKVLQEVSKEYQQLMIYRKDYKQLYNVSQKLKQKVLEQSEELQQVEEKRKTQLAKELAHQLTDGTPCPVCGSTEHPNKVQLLSDIVTEQTVEKERSNKLEMEEEFKNLEFQLLQVKEKGEAKAELVEHLRHSISSYDKNMPLDQIAKYNHEINLHLTELQSNYNQKQKELNELTVKVEETDKLLQQLENKKLNFKEMKKQYEKKLKDSQQYQIKLSALQETLPNYNISVDKFQQQVIKQEKHYQQMIQRWTEIQKQYEYQYNEMNNSYTRYEQADHFSEQLSKRYHHQKDHLFESLKKHHFSSLDDYHNALKSNEEQEQMEIEIKSYDQQLQFVRQRIIELKEKVEGVSKPNLTSIEQQIETLEHDKTNTTKRIQAIYSDIKQIKNALQSIKALDRELQDLNEKYYHIGELAALARGDNAARLSFERFVLSTFLDEILLQANLRFDKMTDHRYQLVRSEEIAKRGAQSGLDLEVLDHYTGKKRSVKTLSGGEGFKAALSLALGMADIIQAHAGGIQLDTLFIDEGFGTLDEISLEQAIQCLKELQQDHRVIGVISHVQQLKEEIKAKLIIQTSHEGSTASFSIE
ncbi:AAA family ATPase [Gracilibacillus sp. YIM 98692]|uniref:AAA family ATPase n=1 Tax=Gracilibacillus sp. YIM 98692 TaxID=2663532 RepID=UPI0013D2A47E|nr:AAA family ATPase [Gracilibacillus sp. YIM 98692]